MLEQNSECGICKAPIRIRSLEEKMREFEARFHRKMTEEELALPAVCSNCYQRGLALMASQN